MFFLFSSQTFVYIGYTPKDGARYKKNVKIQYDSRLFLLLTMILNFFLFR